MRAALLGLLVLPAAYLGFANLWLATGAHTLAGRRPEKFQAEWSRAYTVWPGKIHFRDLELRGRNSKVLWSASLAEGSLNLDWQELFGREVRIENLRGSGFRFFLRPRPLNPGEPEEPEEPDEPGEPPRPAGQNATGPTAAPQPQPDLASSASPSLPGGAPDLESQLPQIPGFDGLPEPSKSGKPPWSITIDDFQLDEVAEVWLERYHYQASGPGGRFAGSLHLRLRRSVELPDFTIELAPGSLAVENRQLAHLDRCRLAGALHRFLTRRYKLFELVRFYQGEIDLEATDSDLSALEYYLRGAPVELGGQGRLTAHLLLDAGVVGPGSRLAVQDARLELAYLDYWGRGNGSVEVTVDGAADTAAAKLFARLGAFELGVKSATAAHLRGTGLEITATTSNLDLGDPRPRLRGEIHMPATEIPDFRVYNSLWPKSFPLELESGRAELKSTLRFSTTDTGHQAEAALELRGHGIRALLLDNRMIGDFRLEASLYSERLESRRFDLHGTRLEIRDLAGDWQPKTHGWWANIEIPRGHLELAKPNAFDFELAAQMADTSPLVAALLAKKPAFDWMSRLLTITKLRLETRVEMRGASLALHQLHLAGGGHLEVDGELRLRQKKADGAFHLTYGPLSGAVRLLPDGERDWKLRHSREAYDTWLDDLRRH